MKKFGELRESLLEGHDIHVLAQMKYGSDKIDHYKVHKVTDPNLHDVIGPGMRLNKSDIDDIRDMGHTVKIHTSLPNSLRNVPHKLKEEALEEAADIELKPHPNGKGTHYIVHKSNQDTLKAGETVSDTDVDDLHDSGFKVKIHKK